MITLVALGIAVAVAWHLTRTVVGPVRRLTHGANAIRQGDFSERIDVASRDELGELAAAFNQMAADLAEFRRTNIGEVVRAKNTLEATLEALPDAVVLLDAAGRIQSMNRAAVNVLGFGWCRRPRASAIFDWTVWISTRSQEAVAAGRQHGAPADLARTIRIEQGGSVQRLLPRVVPVPALKPETAGAVLLLYDVTDLVRLDEMRSELVAVASHELQTPLTTLRMTLLMLQEASDVLPQRQRELVATSLIGVEQLSETVHEFLDLTRIEAGELRLNLEPVSVGAAIAESIRQSRGTGERAGRQTGRHSGGRPAAGSPLIRCGCARSFDNILSNALKYTPETGTHHDRDSARTDSERRRTRDGLHQYHRHGPGIPAAFRTRIFDKFFRLEHHQTEGQPGARGAGIGLYMCRQIVELHGGEISCGAGVGGRGTRITVTLPTLGTNEASTAADSAYVVQ